MKKGTFKYIGITSDVILSMCGLREKAETFINEAEKMGYVYIFRDSPEQENVLVPTGMYIEESLTQRYINELIDDGYACSRQDRKGSFLCVPVSWIKSHKDYEKHCQIIDELVNKIRQV